MRMALLSDIHGNTLALEAVLADIERQGGVDSYWVLGDLSGMGYDPVGVLERVTRLPNVSFVRGNHDRYVVTGERSGPTLEQAQAHPQLVMPMYAMATSHAWTLGQIQGAGWWDWFMHLPLEVRLTLPDGTRMLGVHSVPGADDGAGLIPLLSDDELREVLAPAAADLVIAGHTHVPLDRTVDGIRVFNLGSISNPMRANLAASYALLEADEQGYNLQLRYVDYDRQAVIDELARLKHPAARYVAAFVLGEITPPWMRDRH